MERKRIGKWVLSVLLWFWTGGVYFFGEVIWKTSQGTDAENAAEFDAYVAKCKELSLYDTGVSAEYGDKLISLSTCEYSRNNGRLVVVAKRVD